MGYSVIAFNLVIPQSVDPTSLAPYFPFGLTSPPFPELDPRTCSVDDQAPKVLQLSRLTLVLDGKVVGGGRGVFGFVSRPLELATGADILQSTAQTKYLERFNILAAQPLDAASFGHACLSLSAPVPHGVDIISLDLASSPRRRSVPFLQMHALTFRSPVHPPLAHRLKGRRGKGRL